MKAIINQWLKVTYGILLKNKKGEGADDVKEVQEIVQHLFINIVKPPARSKRYSQQAKTHCCVDQLLFKLVDDLLAIWDADSFLDRAQVLMKRQIDEHANYNTSDSPSQKRSGDKKTNR